jgi:hypothetical protein
VGYADGPDRDPSLEWLPMTILISAQSNITDDERRRRLYDGEVFNLPPRDSVRAFGDFAWELIVDAFGDLDPTRAFEHLPVEEYVAILGPLKTGFTHHPRAKELLTAALVDLGCDPEKTYFDVPKLRIVTPASYLTAGLGYNYKPHRDTWYSAPQCQVNWWAPIRGLTRESSMAFHPDYWARASENSSKAFDAYEWNRSGRRDAAQFVTSDPRPHPHLLGTGPGAEVRLLGDPGSVLVFSGAQLHSTVPNTSGGTRFSVDFRTVNIDDLVAHAGPENVDSESTGTTLRDFLRMGTYEGLPAELIATYDENGSEDGVLVFDPATLDA